MKKSRSQDQTRPLSTVPEPPSGTALRANNTSQAVSAPLQEADQQDYGSLLKRSQEREERFSTILNHAAVGIAQVNLQRKYVFANQYFCRLVGRTPEQLYQLRIDDITHPDDLDRTLQLFDQLIHQNYPRRCRKAIRTTGWIRGLGAHHRCLCAKRKRTAGMRIGSCPRHHSPA